VIAEIVVSLAPGESRELPVTFEGATEGSVTLFAERMDELTATVDGEPFQRGSKEFPIMSARVRGREQATVMVVNTGARPMGLALTVEALTDRILTVTVDASALAGEPVEVEVTLTEATPEDHPTMTLWASDGTLTPVRLTALTVGRWKAVLQPPPGDSYRLQAAVEGPRPRRDVGFISVGAAGVTILPGFRERMIRGDDGLASELILTVTIDSESEVEGSLDATPVDAAGADVAISHRRLTIEAGRHEYDIVFDGAEIGGDRSRGPYRLMDVRVVGPGLIPVATLDDAGTTDASDPRSFSHFAVEFDLDAFAARTIDEDHDGLFEALVVSGRVHVDEAGRYSVQGGLFAGDTQVTESFAAQDLAAGWNDIEIVFSGSEIKARGLDGPFDVRHVSLTGNRRDDPAATGFVTAATSTADHAASSFED